MSFLSSKVARGFAQVGLTIGGLSAIVAATFPTQAMATIAHLTAWSCNNATFCIGATNRSTGSAVSGTTFTGVGVVGSSGGIGTGVYAISHTGVGLIAKGTANDAIQATTSDSQGGGASAVDAFDNGTTASGHGVSGYSNSGYALYAQSGAYGLVDFSKGTAIFASAVGTSGQAFLAVANSSTAILRGSNSSLDQDVVSIDNMGNEILAGTLTQSGQPLIRTATSGGKTVAAYTARTSTPTLEDFAETRLVNGAADVVLDPSFAATIDTRAKYMVFLSPQGDNRGLYVTGISSHGFSIRESNGGHSTLTIDYRIVAKPFDTNAARLAPTTAFSGLAHGRALLPTPKFP